MEEILQQQTHERYMKMALKEAQDAFAAGEVPVGAIIVHHSSASSSACFDKAPLGDRVIARAHNLVETLRDATAHAEMQAITIASGTLGSKYLNDCTIYVTVEPCPMCAAALGWSQIGEVVYGATDPKKGFSLFEPHIALSSPSVPEQNIQQIKPSIRFLHPKTNLVSGICADEASELMKRFFIERR